MCQHPWLVRGHSDRMASRDQFFRKKGAGYLVAGREENEVLSEIEWPEPPEGAPLSESEARVEVLVMFQDEFREWQTFQDAFERSPNWDDSSIRAIRRQQLRFHLNLEIRNILRFARDADENTTDFAQDGAQCDLFIRFLSSPSLTDPLCDLVDRTIAFYVNHPHFQVGIPVRVDDSRAMHNYQARLQVVQGAGPGSSDATRFHHASSRYLKPYLLLA